MSSERWGEVLRPVMSSTESKLETTGEFETFRMSDRSWRKRVTQRHLPGPRRIRSPPPFRQRAVAPLPLHLVVRGPRQQERDAKGGQ